MKHFLFVFLTLLILHSASSIAFACSCEGDPVGETEEHRVERSYQKAQAIFSGKVLRIKKGKSHNGAQVFVRITKHWKGIDTQRTVVVEDAADCMYGFRVGKEYLIYAYNLPNDKLGENLSTSECSRNRELIDASKDLEMLNKQSKQTK